MIKICHFITKKWKQKMKTNIWTLAFVGRELGPNVLGKAQLAETQQVYCELLLIYKRVSSWTSPYVLPAPPYKQSGRTLSLTTWSPLTPPPNVTSTDSNCFSILTRACPTRRTRARGRIFKFLVGQSQKSQSRGTLVHFFLW